MTIKNLRRSMLVFIAVALPVVATAVEPASALSVAGQRGNDGTVALPAALAAGPLMIFGSAGPAASASPLHFAPQSPKLVTGPPLDGTKKLGDVNGDGKADLVLFSFGGQNGAVYVALATASGFQAPRRWHNYFCVGSEICDVADVNGDKKADIISFVHGDGQQDGSADVWVAYSDGTKFGQPNVWNDGFCITEQICRTADVNGDKRADLVAFTPKTGLVWTSLSTGSRFDSNAVWHKYFCILGEMCEVGDVNGDGRADLIAFKPNAPAAQKGNVLWAASTGTGFATVQLGHGYFCIGAESCYVGDFNGDGRTDVMLLKGHPNGLESLVSLSNGTAFINPSPFTWADGLRGYGTPAMVGDVNGDGKADLVTYETVNSNTTRYLVSLTTDQQTQPSPPPPLSPPPNGVRAVNFYNCVPEHDENGGFRPLYFWTQDLSAGSGPSSSGAIEDLYDDSGSCPAAGSRPYTVNLVDQHYYRIVAVDPAGIACNGQNDPNQLGCIRQEFVFRGNGKGVTLNVIVPTG